MQILRRIGQAGYNAALAVGIVAGIIGFPFVLAAHMAASKVSAVMSVGRSDGGESTNQEPTAVGD